MSYIELRFADGEWTWMKVNIPGDVFPSAEEDASVAEPAPEVPQTFSPSCRHACTDTDFLLGDELRSVRPQLEPLKPELLLQDHGIHATIVVFGSAHTPDMRTARKLGSSQKRGRQPSRLIRRCHFRSQWCIAFSARLAMTTRRGNWGISSPTGHVRMADANSSW
jgi:hypothetical protein